MTRDEALARVLNGPSPTYWEWVYSGRVNQYGVHEGGNVLRCAHCRRGLHDHATDCAWLGARAAVRRLQVAIERTAQHHREYVGQTVDGSGTYSMCRFCDHPWPCDGYEVVKAAEGLSEIAAALDGRIA